MLPSAYPFVHGYIRLKNVEAYVLQDLTVPLLIGEDIQTPWQLHTLRLEGQVSWQVGDSEHCCNDWFPP